MGHNGKRTQFCPNFPDSSGAAFEFCDNFKQCGWWSGNTRTLNPDEVDTDGWPIILSDGKAQMSIPIPTQAQRPGNYVLYVDGTGTIQLPSLGNTAFSGTNTRRLITSSPGVFYTISIVSTGNPSNSGSDYIRNIRFCHVDDESALLAGKYWRPGYVSMVAEYGIHRLLNSQNSNFNHVRLASERKPITYYSFLQSRIVPTLWAGTTTSVVGATIAYSISNPGFVLTHGARIHLRFDHAGSTTVPQTLNVEGTGDIPLILRNGNPLPPATSFVLIAANTVSSAIYDAGLGGWCVGNSSGGASGFDYGVPWEAIVQLANDAGVHIWVSPPALACDTPDTLPDYRDLDYITQQLEYYDAHLDDGLKIFQEATTNEDWNSQFFGTQYSWRRELARNPTGGTFNHNNWAGQTGSLIGQVCRAVFGDAPGTRYELVMGMQAAGGTTGSVLDRLESTAYVARLGGDTTKAAKNFLSYIAPACYFNSRYFNTVQETSWAYEYQLVGTTTARKAEIRDDYARGLAGTAGNSNLTSQLAVMATFHTLAESYGIKLCTYEGGPSTEEDVLGTSSATITGVTRGNPTVLTVGSNAFQNPMTTTISSVGGTTGLNGNTYTVLSADATTVTIDVDSSGMSAYTSGGSASYVGSSTWKQTLIRTIRDAPLMRNYIARYHLAFAQLGSRAEWASEFDFSGAASHSWSTWLDVFGAKPYRALGCDDFNSNRLMIRANSS